MAILKKLSITGRIASGFGGMIVILLIAGAVAYIQAAGMEKNVHHLEDMAGDALLASELNADMAKVLLYTREYMSDRTKESLETARKYLGETKEGIEKARAEMHKPSRVALVQKMDADIKTFETGLTQIVALYTKRDAIVTNQLDRIGPVVRKGLTEINESATREAAYETANLAGRAQEDFLLARLYVNKYLLSNSNEDAERAQSSINDALAEMERLGASISTPQRKKTFDTTVPSIREYRDAIGQVGALIAERNKLRDETVVKTGRAVSQWAAEIKASAVVDQHALASDVVAEAQKAEWVMILLNVAGLVIAALLAFFIARSISRPVNTLTSAMSQLATGDLSTEVPATERHDEIGKMAKALMVFKEALIANKEAEAAAAVEADAKMRRAQLLDEMTKQFEANVSALTHGLASAATEMEATAQVMTETAQQTTGQSVSVASAAEQTSANVQTVAVATEELSSSIREISEQVAKSSTIAGRAAEEAKRTDATVQALAAGAQKIGDVVALINNIAGQTNLLALNATIEAARAGEAGRGFAVVATEVKALASQTAKATEEIAAQIDGIQAETQQVVAAIQTIGATIDEMNVIASGVAAAMEEQGAATQEIARNVQQAAQGTQVVTGNILDVKRGAGETGSAASQVLSAAQELSRHSEDLGREVDSFLSGVKAA